MDEIRIENGTLENKADICAICIPPQKKEDPDFKRGIADKCAWSEHMLKTWGDFARIAYIGNEQAGFIQYQPVPEEQIVRIDCIYVPRKHHWRKGAATKLLANLIDDLQEPKAWFGNKTPLALVVETFPGGGKGQLSAREFFSKKGFRQIGKNPDHLYCPLQKGFEYSPVSSPPREYIFHEEDKGKALIISGPSNCPFIFPYLLKFAEKYIREIDKELPIVWLEIKDQPEEIKKRNLEVTDCIVNGKKIESFVADKEGFQKEVREALKKSPSS